MLHHPNLCENKKLSHNEIIDDISNTEMLRARQNEFIATNPPIDMDTVPADVVVNNAKTNQIKNTKCIRCSPTGVLSNKQVVVKAAGSTIIYDPEKYTIEDRNRNLSFNYLSLFLFTIWNMGGEITEKETGTGKHFLNIS